VSVDANETLTSSSNRFWGADVAAALRALADTGLVDQAAMHEVVDALSAAGLGEGLAL
jgi:hypothetical protein